MTTPQPVNSQTVILTYFKDSGKYYSEGRFVTKKVNEFEVCEEVRLLQRSGELPDLVEGGGKEFTILITYDNGLLSVPSLIKPIKVAHHPV